MLLQDRQLAAFNQVSVGNTSTLQIPVGAITYYEINLEYREAGTLATQANMEDGINEIRLLVDGKIVRRHTAQDLFDMAAHYGVTIQDGVIPLFFWEPWANDIASMLVFRWGTANVRSLTLEVDIDASATTPTLSATALQSNELQNLGAIRKFNKYTVNVAGTGVTNFPTLPTSDSYKALHARDGGDIDDVEVIVNGNKIFGLTDDEMKARIGNNPNLTRISDYFHIQFDPLVNMPDLLPMTTVISSKDAITRGRQVQDFQLNFNMNTATSFTLLAETVGPVLNEDIRNLV